MNKVDINIFGRRCVYGRQINEYLTELEVPFSCKPYISHGSLRLHDIPDVRIEFHDNEFYMISYIDENNQRVCLGFRKEWLNNPPKTPRGVNLASPLKFKFV